MEDHVWFAPLPPDLPIVPGREFTGSVDFMGLFTPAAPWGNASRHVDVFKLYGEWVGDVATDAQLKQVVSDLNRRGIVIAVEAGPLNPTSYCGRDVEGFAGADSSVQIVNRIREAGGTTNFLSMDEPFAFASLYSGPQACHWSPEKVAGEVAKFIKKIRAVSPNIIVGDTEPLWQDVNITEYERWMDAFQNVVGYPLPFFHLDVDWTRPDWPQAALQLEAYTKDHGVKFGIIYNGDISDQTDHEWTSHAAERMVEYEVRHGGSPNQVLFQSWVDKPDCVLPETAPDTFTHLILLYARERTSLGMLIGQASPGETRVLSGSLNTFNGKPLVGMSVIVTMKLEEGAAIFAEYTVSGVVPATATKADVGFRVNQECGCVGSSDFDVYWVRYIEGTSQANHVPNGDFSEALDWWSYWGNGTVGLEPSDMGPGSMLHVVATRNQSVGMNSGEFVVSPGDNYTVVFGAKITPRSVGSGYLSLVFMGQTEVLRKMIDLEPPLLVLGTTTTNDSGAFNFTLQGLPAGTLLIQVEYMGDDTCWPAYAEATIVN
jgi:hypothetical protein